MADARPIAVFLVGMQASGKTELSKEICHRLQPCRVFSDFLRGKYAGLVDAVDFAKLEEAIAEGSNVVLNDVSWIKAQKLSRATAELREIAPGHEQFVVYFENDPARCVVNEEDRNVNAEECVKYIRYWTDVYEVPNPLPSNAVVVPAWAPWTGERSVQRVLDSIQK